MKGVELPISVPRSNVDSAVGNCRRGADRVVCGRGDPERATGGGIKRKHAADVRTFNAS